MVSPQNPTPGIVSDIAAGRGFIPPAAEQLPATALQPALLQRSYVGWGGVFAGTFLAVSVFVLSSSFAYACGVPAFRGGEYGLGAGLWSVITAILAFYAGGCLAAYMAPSDYRLQNTIHGAAVWAVTISFIALIYSVGTGLLSHSSNVLGANVTMMTINGNPLGNQLTRDAQAGPAWGAFLSLFIGLIAASFGGSSVTGRREYLAQRHEQLANRP